MPFYVIPISTFKNNICCPSLITFLCKVAVNEFELIISGALEISPTSGELNPGANLTYALPLAAATAKTVAIFTRF